MKARNVHSPIPLVPPTERYVNCIFVDRGVDIPKTPTSPLGPFFKFLL